MNYGQIHTFIAAFAESCAYKATPRAGEKAKNVSATAWHNTFTIEASGKEIGLSGTAARMSREITLSVLKHVPTLSKLTAHPALPWTALLENEAESLVQLFWKWVRLQRPADLGIDLKAIKCTVEPQSEKEGNYYAIVLKLPVFYKLTTATKDSL